VSRRNTEADDPAREEIHDDHDPVALENNRFTTAQIDVPQAVRCVSNEGEPGWTIASRGRSETLALRRQWPVFARGGRSPSAVSAVSAASRRTCEATLVRLEIDLKIGTQVNCYEA
jgi:hypothetical protein